MKTIAILLSTLLLTPIPVSFAQSKSISPTTPIAQANDSELPSPQEVQQTAKNITVRVTSANNGGSGVLIAKKGNTYLVLTNAHVTRRGTKFEIQAPDGQKYTAKPLDGGFDPKYDLALLQFTSKTKYTLADLSDIASPLAPERTIYSAGFPFDAKNIRITSGEVSQLSDLPFDNGTQIGYTTNKGEKGIRQGMSGGAILDGRGTFLGINTIGAAPILPNYTYSDGSKPIAKLAAKYREANWGIPVYNFLVQVKPDILYGYQFSGLQVGDLQRQITPTGYLAKLNQQARQMTVRIEAGGANGSGIIIAKEGNSYYVLTAKHVVFDLVGKTKQLFTDTKIITYDQDSYNPTSTVVAESTDLAIVKFSSSSNYPLAQLGEYSPNNDNLVFVGGFPGRKAINSPLWQWQLNPGFILDRESGKLTTQDNLSFADGYDLYYGNISYGGMSGGPVFDHEGRVVGIHGKAEGVNIGADKKILGGSLGISIQSFTGLLTKLKIDRRLLKISKTPPTALSATDRQTVLTAMQNIPQPQAGDTGERWLAYGNQLTRTLQFKQSIVAFDKAIAKGEILYGNYGKTLSLLILGNYALAQGSIGKSIGVVPANQRANFYYFWKYQSRILARLKKYDQALQSIDLALALKPKDSILLNEKAQFLNEQKKYPAAIAIYDDLIRTQQPDAYIYNNRGLVKFQSKDFKGALTDFDRAININPNFTLAYIARSAAKIGLQDTKGALVDCSRAIEINPNSVEAYVIRGLVKVVAKDFNGAISDSDRAVKLTNLVGFNQSINGSRSMLDAVYYVRILAKIGLQDLQGVLTYSNQAIKINSRFTVAYIYRSLAKVSLQDFQGAFADTNTAIELIETSKQEDSILLTDANTLSLPYLLRGGVKAELSDNQGAIADYNKSIKINPNSPDAYYLRGLTNAKLDRKQDAIADYNQAIKINPNYADAYYNRGITKYSSGDKQGAISDYTQAIKVKPSAENAYYLRGNARFSLGDNQGAISDYTQSIKINPASSNAYTSRGIVKSQLGDEQGAIVDYNKAIGINPKDTAAIINIGLISYDKGDTTTALQNWQRAIDIDPQSAEPKMAKAVGLFVQGKQTEATTLLSTVVSIDARFTNIEYLKQNIWGKKLLEDTRKFMQTDRAKAIISNQPVNKK
jgi:tetratricopeptide (TPR) repeat protein/S1-C subfamily serine protease